jgi:hypothetical protein
MVSDSILVILSLQRCRADQRALSRPGYSSWQGAVFVFLLVEFGRAAVAPVGAGACISPY